MASSQKIATTEVLNVRLPSQVINMLDQLVEKKLFANRSEAIREFCREYVNNNKRRKR